MCLPFIWMKLIAFSIEYNNTLWIPFLPEKHVSIYLVEIILWFFVLAGWGSSIEHHQVKLKVLWITYGNYFVSCWNYIEYPTISLISVFLMKEHGIFINITEFVSWIQFDSYALFKEFYWTDRSISYFDSLWNSIEYPTISVISMFLVKVQCWISSNINNLCMIKYNSVQETIN